MTPESQRPSRAAALKRLGAFVPRAAAYAADRNWVRQGNQGVSLLSPYLRRRLLQEREALAAVVNQHPSRSDKFVQEVLWRTYWNGWLEMRPQVWRAYLDRLSADRDRLSGDELDRLHAAVRGETDIDCFNHWARELRQTGYLHNHARMWFASIWIFTLRLPWTLGASHFLSHLLDGDPASNTLSWRWVGGLHTPGKHYLARASNIAKYTDGVFDPRGRLDERAQALSPDEFDCRPRPCQEPPAPDPARTSGLLLTSEDLTPEYSELRQFRFAALAGGWDQQIVEAFDLSPQVIAFSRGALEDGLGRASSHFGIAAHPLSSENWIDDALVWARTQRLEQVVTLYAPVGAWAQRLDLLAKRLAPAGIRLALHRRRWDRALWPGASAGYFRFRKQAGQRLRELLAPQRQPRVRDRLPAPTEATNSRFSSTDDLGCRSADFNFDPQRMERTNMKMTALTRNPPLAAGSVAIFGALAMLAASPSADAKNCGMMKRPPPQWVMPMHQPIPYFQRQAMPGGAKLGAMGEPGPSVVSVAKRSGDFGTLLTLVEAAGLTGLLEGDGPYTLFAPTDAAFKKLPEGALQKLLSDEARLTEVLKMHLVPGRVGSVKILESRDLKTASGKTIATVDIRVKKADIPARNGVIHVVDRVILPSG